MTMGKALWEMETRGGKRWGGGAREETKIGWLMFYDTWSNTCSAMYWGGGEEGEAVSCIGREGGGGAREIQGGGKGWLVDVV